MTMRRPCSPSIKARANMPSTFRRVPARCGERIQVVPRNRGTPAHLSRQSASIVADVSYRLARSVAMHAHRRLRPSRLLIRRWGPLRRSCHVALHGTAPKPKMHSASESWCLRRRARHRSRVRRCNHACDPYAFATAILQIAKNRRSISPAPRIITIDEISCNHGSCCARSLRVRGRFSFSCASSPFGREAHGATCQCASSGNRPRLRFSRLRRCLAAGCAAIGWRNESRTHPDRLDHWACTPTFALPIIFVVLARLFLRPK